MVRVERLAAAQRVLGAQQARAGMHCWLQARLVRTGTAAAAQRPAMCAPSPCTLPALLCAAHRMRVINPRADVVFRLVRNGSTLPWMKQVVVAAESPVVRNAVKDLPAQVHLALDADGRWVTAVGRVCSCFC